LSAGAFSDNEVVKASEKLTRIMVISGKHDQIRKKFGVTSSPQIFFLSSDGKKVAEGGRSSDGLIKQIDEIAQKYNRSPKWAESEESAVKTAKEEQKPLVVYYRDDKARSEQALQEFNLLPVADLYGKAVWVQRTIDVKSDEAKALGITSVPAVWIVDARVDDAKARVLKKIAPKAGTLKTELGAILKSWKKNEASKEEPKEDPKE
jgi:hypothetical protein